jgi:hypothetical protein
LNASTFDAHAIVRRDRRNGWIQLFENMSAGAVAAWLPSILGGWKAAHGKIMIGKKPPGRKPTAAFFCKRNY